ncbi:GNAT family N-acetyltransferase [Sphingomonas sp. GCM10030256]|uniref:GNAT family N-acetyltransferase n=1 Tax=Sphingomonas sp. GCM10030256 TaxID=3273427 RepID=UPI00360B61A3
MSGKCRSAPVLETERLRLRQFTKDDFSPYLAIVGDPDVMRHFGGVGMSAEECWRRMAASTGQWPMIGIGGWAVERLSDGKLVGTLSLFNAWRDLQPDFGDTPEMGWIFATEVHGQGIAGEACRAVLGWAERTLRPTPIWAIIAPANEPSLRLAERLGFEQVGESVYHDEPTLVLQRPAWG